MTPNDNESPQPVGILFEWLNERFLSGTCGWPNDSRMGRKERNGCDKNTFEVCRHLVVLPDTQENDCSYAEWLVEHAPADVQGDHRLPLVAPATHFVSHSWGFNFQMMIRTLREFVSVSTTAEERNAGIYFWIDIFVIDQHKALRGELTGEFWETTFRQNINQIGHTVLVLDDKLPLALPTVLTRIWCIWEIYSTISGDNLMSIALENKSVRLEDDLLNDARLQLLLKSMEAIKSANAEASVASDQEKIFALVSASPGGHTEIDDCCRGVIYGLLLSMAARHLDELNEEHMRGIECLLSLPHTPLDTLYHGRSPLVWALVLGKLRLAEMLEENGCDTIRTTKLDLNGYGDTIGYGTVGNENKLSDVPISIFRITTLVELNLSNNMLSLLPEEFSSFVSLRSLDLSINIFVHFPSILFRLGDTLECVNLSTNRLEGALLLSECNVNHNWTKMTKLQLLDTRFNDGVDSSVLSAIEVYLPSICKLPFVVSLREKAEGILLTRFACQQGLGVATKDDVKELFVDELNETLFYINIDGGGSVGGWGNKAAIANLNLSKCFVTQMGFHRKYWDLCGYRAVGAPTSEEYGHSNAPHEGLGGATQHFEHGDMHWNSRGGVFITMKQEEGEKEKEGK